MDTIDILLLICVVLSLVFFIWTSQELGQIFYSPEGGSPFAGRRILHWTSMLPELAMCVVYIPLPVFYILLYVTGCIVQIPAQKEPQGAKTRKWLLVNVCFLIFVAPHMIILGLLALAAQTDVQSVLTNPALRMLSLMAVLLLDTVLTLILMRWLNRKKSTFLHEDSEELRLFSRFVRFCVCSVVLDSVPCLFPLPTKLSVYFLIGSNLLLMMMAFLFANHLYTIVRDAHLKDEYFRLQEEATMQHSRTEQLEHEAYLDVLTGLYTRAYVLTNLNDMLKNGENLIVAFLDLDGLKKVNDQQGHLAGDQYLQRFSIYVKESLRPNDIFARYGGDEFLVLMPDYALEDAVCRLAQIQAAASAQNLPFSYGLVQAAADSVRTAEEYIAAADHGMYENKKWRRMHRKGD